MRKKTVLASRQEAPMLAVWLQSPRPLLDCCALSLQRVHQDLGQAEVAQTRAERMDCTQVMVLLVLTEEAGHPCLPLPRAEGRLLHRCVGLKEPKVD